MDLTKIIAITGKPGLFELVSQTKGGFIIKDLISQKKLSINANSQVSLLQNISIYTHESEVSLISVLLNISKKHGYKKVVFDSKNAQNLKTLMVEIQPDYAEDRVYNSDLKKLFNWYNILVENAIITEENVKSYEEALNKPEAKIEKNETTKNEIVETKEAKKKVVKKETNTKTKAPKKEVKKETEVDQKEKKKPKASVKKKTEK